MNGNDVILKVEGLNTYFYQEIRFIHILGARPQDSVFSPREETAEEQSFAGMNFVITGSLEHFSNRSEAKALIESLGGKVTGSVTGKTSYLINNDKTSGSSKNKKAAELGIPVLSEEEFLKLAGRDPKESE